MPGIFVPFPTCSGKLDWITWNKLFPCETKDFSKLSFKCFSSGASLFSFNFLETKKASPKVGGMVKVEGAETRHTLPSLS